ncbi:MAG: hypothetical protein K8S13_05395 [Desulfobacula sp.]|nr:hypothetical protein [Desulfobacula sp.]MCD4719281.1 hypothetical protein [Desulfobacula sp.]
MMRTTQIMATIFFVLICFVLNTGADVVDGKIRMDTKAFNNVKIINGGVS